MNLETLEDLAQKDAMTCPRASVYMHVIYIREDPSVIGAYIGSGLKISARI